mmetsp:Transcript_21544/g.32892  ORF Transcript_21544/g.32892 Transcript_21544/m.32892 type:complete len:113 (-) Transcript_21544:1329-1667(-)
MLVCLRSSVLCPLSGLELVAFHCVLQKHRVEAAGAARKTRQHDYTIAVTKTYRNSISTRYCNQSHKKQNNKAHCIRALYSLVLFLLVNTQFYVVDWQAIFVCSILFQAILSD